MSDHVEPRISLSAVQRSCRVLAAQPGTRPREAARLPSDAGDSSYVCMYFYDIDNMSLRALSGAERSAFS